jgi:hypothetical protein
MLFVFLGYNDIFCSICIKNWPTVPNDGSFVAGSKQARLDGSLAFVGGFMLFCFAKPEQNSFRRESSDATLVYKWFLSSQSARNKNNGEEEK